MPEMPVSPDDVREQVARIIASDGFGRSDLLVRFLRLVVESTLRGDAEKLKEFVIGVEAYGRGPEFDPRVDSIVRTEARRLRRKLATYYASEGREDPVLIELPTGSYEPLFRFRQDGIPFQLPPEEPGEISAELAEETAGDFSESGKSAAFPARFRFSRLPRWTSPALRYGGVVLLTCAACFFYERYSASSAQSIRRLALLPVTCTPDTEVCRTLGGAFVRNLGSDLEHSGTLLIVEPPAVAGSAPQAAISQVGSQFKADHVFRAALEKSDKSWFLTAHITSADDDVTISTWGLDCSWGNVAVDEAQVLNDILAYAGSTRRAYRSAALQEKTSENYRLYARAEYAFGSFNVLRQKVFSDYAEQQLNRSLRLDPTFNDARILLARLYREQIWGTEDKTALLEQSRKVLETAEKFESKSADVKALLGAVYWDLGQRERGMKLVQQAVQLEPLSGTARTEIAQLYAGMGLLESSVNEADKGLALDPTTLRALGFQIVYLSLLHRQAEAAEALNEFRESYSGALADLFAADQQLRAGNLEEAGRLISSGRERATDEMRSAFDIADGLRAALMGNRAAGARIFDQYKSSPTRFWDHLILLGAQIGEADATIKLIRRSSLYSNYRYLTSERRLSPLRADPSFRALLSERYAMWQRDLSQYGASLPDAPPRLPPPEQPATEP